MAEKISVLARCIHLCHDFFCQENGNLISFLLGSGVFFLFSLHFSLGIYSLGTCGPTNWTPLVLETSGWTHWWLHQRLAEDDLYRRPKPRSWLAVVFFSSNKNTVQQPNFINKKRQLQPLLFRVSRGNFVWLLEIPDTNNILKSTIRNNNTSFHIFQLTIAINHPCA